MVSLLPVQTHVGKQMGPQEQAHRVALYLQDVQGSFRSSKIYTVICYCHQETSRPHHYWYSHHLLAKLPRVPETECRSFARQEGTRQERIQLSSQKNVGPVRQGDPCTDGLPYRKNKHRRRVTNKRPRPASAQYPPGPRHHTSSSQSLDSQICGSLCLLQRVPSSARKPRLCHETTTVPSIQVLCLRPGPTDPFL